MFRNSPAFSHVTRYSLALPPSLTPAAMKKLVEKRNAQFCDAVNELLDQFVKHSSLYHLIITYFGLGLLSPKTPSPCYKNLAGDLFLRMLPGTGVFLMTHQKSPYPRADFLPLKSSKKCKSKVGTKIKYSSDRRRKRDPLVQVRVESFPPQRLHLTPGLRNSRDTAVDGHHDCFVQFATDIFPLLPPNRGNQCTGRRPARHR